MNPRVKVIPFTDIENAYIVINVLKQWRESV